MGAMTIARYIAITPISIIVGLAGALIGLIEVVFLDRLIYPAIRRGHERKKVTGTQRTDPAVIMQFIKFQGLVVLPVLGFLFGEHLFGDYLRGVMSDAAGGMTR
jgi:hypothetical protein